LLISLISVSKGADAQISTCSSPPVVTRDGNDTFVVNPKEGMCTTCHTVTTETDKETKHPDNLTITLSRQGSDLCYKCHEPKDKKKTVHAPVMGGDCISCHNPHQSANKGLLKEAMPRLCFQCHPESMMKQGNMHPPVAAGDCSGCHDNHQSDFPSRLVQEGNALCFTCHPDKEDGIKTKKVVHLPAKQSCILCHSAHGSANKAMLVDAVPGVCSICHPNESTLAKKAIIKHGPMNDTRSCMNCHDPHFSEQKGLLSAAQTDLCVGCHNTEMDTESGKVKDLMAFLAANEGGQGPLKGKACVTCHNPHGSDYRRLLVKYYTPEFYTRYSNNSYAICLTCHAKEAFVKERAGDKIQNYPKPSFSACEKNVKAGR
jgi:predicted CXXCH cytochrome family protein